MQVGLAAQGLHLLGQRPDAQRLAHRSVGERRERDQLAPVAPAELTVAERPQGQQTVAGAHGGEPAALDGHHVRMRGGAGGDQQRDALRADLVLIGAAELAQTVVRRGDEDLVPVPVRELQAPSVGLPEHHRRHPGDPADLVQDRPKGGVALAERADERRRGGLGGDPAQPQPRRARGPGRGVDRGDVLHQQTSSRRAIKRRFSPSVRCQRTRSMHAASSGRPRPPSASAAGIGGAEPANAGARSQMATARRASLARATTRIVPARAGEAVAGDVRAGLGDRQLAGERDVRGDALEQRDHLAGGLVGAGGIGGELQYDMAPHPVLPNTTRVRSSSAGASATSCAALVPSASDANRRARSACGSRSAPSTRPSL